VLNERGGECVREYGTKTLFLQPVDGWEMKRMKEKKNKKKKKKKKKKPPNEALWSTL